MQVILNTDRVSGYGVIQRQGDVVDIPDAEARRMIANGSAAIPEKECAAVGAPENAMHNQPQRRNRRNHVSQ